MSIRGRKATVSRSTARIDLLSFERNDAEVKVVKEARLKLYTLDVPRSKKPD